MNRFHQPATFITAAVALVALGCNQSGPSGEPPAATHATLPAELFVSSPPAGIRGVREVKARDSRGGEVVIHGRIGGRMDPFVPGAAVFLLVDDAVQSCADSATDDCKTPWDYCCEPRENLIANIATIQVVDEAGKPLRGDIRGLHGLEPLAHVTVTGNIVANDDIGSLVINARQVHVGHPDD